MSRSHLSGVIPCIRAASYSREHREAFSRCSQVATFLLVRTPLRCSWKCTHPVSPAIAATKAFYITVPLRLARLDELVFDPVGFASYPLLLGDELRPVVGPDTLRLAVDEDELHKYRYDTFCQHRNRYLLRYGFTVTIVQFIQHTERTSAFHLVAHKVQRPSLDRLKGSQ